MAEIDLGIAGTTPKQPFDNWFDSLFCEFVDEMLYWDL